LPSELAQESHNFSVSFSIFINFLDPIFSIIDRHALTSQANVAVPEATIYKDNFFQSWKNNVWLAWKIFSMESEAKSKTVNH
jgi:hypothetical protein